MIKLKNILFELSNSAKNKLKALWKTSNREENESEFDFYIKKFEENFGSSLFPKKNIFDYNYEDLKKIIDLNFSKEKTEKEYAYDFNLNNLSPTDKEDLLYEGNGLLILLGDMKPKCIRYGKGYRWCVSRPDTSNMFNSYRFKLGEKVFYFVFDKDKPKSDPNHVLVILIDKDSRIYVADAFNNSNSGRTQVDWNYILELQPKLKDLKDLFKPMPLTPKEKEEFTFFKGSKKVGEYSNLTYDQKEKYISFGHKLSHYKFTSTPYDLKMKYVNSGHELPIKDYLLLKPKDRERYVEIQIKGMRQDYIPTEEDIISFFIRDAEYIKYLPQKYKNLDTIKKYKDKFLSTILPRLASIYTKTKKLHEPWLSLIIKSPKLAYNFAHTIKERFPIGERAIAKNAERSCEYASNVLKDRFKLGEPAILKDARCSAWYARDVIKGRWLEAEPTIAKSATESSEYAYYVMKGRFPAGEPAIAKNALNSYYYAKYSIRGRFPAGEPILARSYRDAWQYARDILQGRFPTAEPILATSSSHSYLYARDAIKGRFPAGERMIAKNSDNSFLYARDIMKGRFPEGEKSILLSKECSILYVKFLIGNNIDVPVEFNKYKSRIRKSSIIKLKELFSV